MRLQVRAQRGPRFFAWTLEASKVEMKRSRAGRRSDIPKPYSDYLRPLANPVLWATTVIGPCESTPHLIFPDSSCPGGRNAKLSEDGVRQLLEKKEGLFRSQAAAKALPFIGSWWMFSGGNGHGLD